MGIFTSGRNKMAFSGKMYCPHPHPRYPNEKCNSTKWKKDEHRSNPLQIRYVCKQCGRGIRYDISNNHNLTSMELTKAIRR